MKSHQTAGKISWSLLHDLMLLERDLPGWLGDCEFFPPDWWINEGSTDTDYMDWYWLISPEMSKLLDQLMIIHIYDDTIWWRIGGSSSETKKYTRWINMLSDSLLHRVLRVFLLKCLVQPIWEMFIYIYIFETWNHQADDCNTWPSNIEILPIKSILSQKNNRLSHMFYRNSAILPIKSCMVRLRMKLCNDIRICPILRHTLISAPYSYTPWRFIIITPKSSGSSYFPHSIAISWVYPMLLDKTKWSR